jgi:hypothetical protein
MYTRVFKYSFGKNYVEIFFVESEAQEGISER